MSCHAQTQLSHQSEGSGVALQQQHDNHLLKFVAQTDISSKKGANFYLLLSLPPPLFSSSISLLEFSGVFDLNSINMNLYSKIVTS